MVTPAGGAGFVEWFRGGAIGDEGGVCAAAGGCDADGPVGVTGGREVAGFADAEVGGGGVVASPEMIVRGPRTWEPLG